MTSQQQYRAQLVRYWKWLSVWVQNKPRHIENIQEIQNYVQQLFRCSDECVKKIHLKENIQSIHITKKIVFAVYVFYKNTNEVSW